MSEREDHPQGRKPPAGHEANGASPAHGSSQQGLSTKPHRRLWVLLAAVLALVMLLVGVVSLVIHSTGKDAAAKHTVTYKATGGSAADLTYSTGTDGTTSQLGGVTLPWTTSIDVTGRTSGLRVSIRNDGAGTVGCEIDVDGKVVASTSLEGKNVSGVCLAP